MPRPMSPMDRMPTVARGAIVLWSGRVFVTMISSTVPLVTANKAMMHYGKQGVDFGYFREFLDFEGKLFLRFN
jgi:hypothetical protein